MLWMLDEDFANLGVNRFGLFYFMSVSTCLLKRRGV